MAARNDCPADRRALLARLGYHLPGDLAYEQLELLIVWTHIRRENGAIQRVCFGVKGDRVRNQISIDPQLGRRVG